MFSIFLSFCLFSLNSFQREIFPLKPDVDPEIITSYLAQNIILVGETTFKILSLNISFNHNSSIRLFYTSQISGPKLNKHSLNYENSSSFNHFSQTPNELIKENDQLKYVFKVVSNFSNECDDEYLVFDILYESFLLSQNFLKFMFSQKTILTCIFLIYFFLLRDVGSKNSNMFGNLDNSNIILRNTNNHYLLLFLYFLCLSEYFFDYIMASLIIFLFVIVRFSIPNYIVFLIDFLFLFFTNDVFSFVYYSIFLLVLKHDYSLILLVIYSFSLFDQNIRLLFPFLYLIELLDYIQISQHNNNNYL